MISIDVIVPTYRRPRLLGLCLTALAKQERLADRVLVVARPNDSDSLVVIGDHVGRLHGLEQIDVTEPGVLAAMAAGVARSTGNVIVFTDDDAAPRRDWTTKLLEHFSDPTVGAAGGRDVVPGQHEPRTGDVGRLRPSGRLTGMHHLGTGRAREVDVLKGVNMAFRAEALALAAPGALRGSGAQVDYEIITCAWAKRRGWRIIYDPAIQVDHEAAIRSGADQRKRPTESAVTDAAFNSVIAASAIGFSALVRHTAYGLAIGTSDRPGLVRALVSIGRHEPEVLRRLRPSLKGRAAAAFSFLVGQTPLAGPRVQSADELRTRSNPRPRITLVAHDVHDAGGMERAHAELIRARHTDFDFTVISTHLAEDLRSLVRWHRVAAPARPFFAKFILFFVIAGLVVRRQHDDLVHTLGAIIPNRVDIVSLHFCHAGYVAATGGLTLAGMPICRRVNSRIARQIALWAERWCYRPERLRAFGAVSGGVQREAALHFPRIPVTLTPNGVDSTRFSPDKERRMAERQAAGIGDNTCLLLFIGGDWDRKGLTMAVEGLAMAHFSGSDVALWVVGPGDQARLKSQAGSFGIESLVTSFGKRADTESFYRAADVFVLPSAYETFSLVCFEAAACELPLIIPPISGAGELVGANGEAGLLVERNAISLASAIQLLANDPGRRMRMGQEARRRAVSFDWATSTTAVANLYRQLLPQPREFP